MGNIDDSLLLAGKVGALKFLPQNVRRAYSHLAGLIGGADADPIDDLSPRQVRSGRADLKILNRAYRQQEKLIAQIRVNAVPKPILLSGSGSKVNAIQLKRKGPVVVEANHSGGSNFIVQLVGNGHDNLLVNAIGSYNGTVVTPDEARAGRYRLPVEADGSWSIKVSQPTVTGGEKPITRQLSGVGSKAISVKAGQTMQPVVRARHRGDSNFVVHLIGYGDVSGTILLFNEIGNFSGEILADQEIPDGTYLVAVEADGRWTVKFTP